MNRSMKLRWLVPMALLAATSASSAATMTFDQLGQLDTTDPFNRTVFNTTRVYSENGMVMTDPVPSKQLKSSGGGGLLVASSGTEFRTFFDPVTNEPFAYIGQAQDYAFSLATGGTFTLDGLDVTGATTNFLRNAGGVFVPEMPYNLYFTGYRAGLVVAEAKYVASAGGVLSFGTTFAGIDRLLLDAGNPFGNNAAWPNGYPQGATCVTTVTFCVGVGVDNLRFTPTATISPVPIPAPFVLLASAVAAVGASAKVRRKAKKA
jgi:hypothetical protein